jgi:hypothetical protein
MVEWGIGRNKSKIKEKGQSPKFEDKIANIQ